MTPHSDPAPRSLAPTPFVDRARALALVTGAARRAWRIGRTAPQPELERAERPAGVGVRTRKEVRTWRTNTGLAAIASAVRALPSLELAARVLIFRSTMRRPRRRISSQLADVTVRCLRSEMRLVPTPERIQLIGYALAAAQALFPGIEVHSVCAMSNHIHLVLRDTDASLSRFMQHAIGHLAQRLNALDKLKGAVFGRRFAEITILDDDALVERIAYAVCNPVEANLVTTHRDWTGLLMFSGRVPWSRTFSHFHQARHRDAIANAGDGVHVGRADFYSSAVLTMTPLSAELARRVDDAIKEREAELRRFQRGVVGMEKVLEVGPLTRPKHSSRSPMPLCFASTREAWLAFQETWRAFVGAFCEASARFRGGDLMTVFPEGAFRPSSSTA